MSAVLHIRGDGHFRRNTPANLESAFARLIVVVVLRLNVMRGSLGKKSCTQLRTSMVSGKHGYLNSSLVGKIISPTTLGFCSITIR